MRKSGTFDRVSSNGLPNYILSSRNEATVVLLILFEDTRYSLKTLIHCTVHITTNKCFEHYC